MSCTPLHPNKTIDVGRMDRYSFITQSMAFTALIFIKPTISKFLWPCAKNLSQHMENVQNMGTISFTPLKSMAFNALFSQNFYVFKSIMWRALSNAIQIS